MYQNYGNQINVQNNQINQNINHYSTPYMNPSVQIINHYPNNYNLNNNQQKVFQKNNNIYNNGISQNIQQQFQNNINPFPLNQGIYNNINGNSQIRYIIPSNNYGNNNIIYQNNNQLNNNNLIQNQKQIQQPKFDPNNNQTKQTINNQISQNHNSKGLKNYESKNLANQNIKISSNKNQLNHPINILQNNQNQQNLNFYNNKIDLTRIYENKGNEAPKIPKKAIDKTYKSICKIYYNNKQGTGFFMLIENNLKCLITNYHIISKNLINDNIIIKLYNNKEIKIELKNRYIKFNEEKDITIIEIKDIDNIINEIDILDYDLNYIRGYNQYKDIEIFALQYPKDDIEVQSGIIKDIINNYEFIHNINTEPGSSGSPIILIHSLKVIGIHKQGDKYKPINYGTFIGEIFKDNNIINNNNIIEGIIKIELKDINKDIIIYNSNYDIDIYIDNDKIKIINGENNIKLYKFNKEGNYHFKMIFNANNINNLRGLFNGCEQIINLDLSNFNTDNVTDMEGMFNKCYKLKEIKGINKFNTKNVTNMRSMFQKCNELLYLDLSNFNTDNVTDMLIWNVCLMNVIN